MSKLVVLNLEKGNLNDGFSPVTAQLWETNSDRPIQFIASLPNALQISELYKRFQLIYDALNYRLRKRSEDLDLEIDDSGLNNVSEVDFAEIKEQLQLEINAWLNSNSFRPIDQQLRARLALDEEFQVIIETSDRLLRRLPWHLWDFFEHYQNAEVAISYPKYDRAKQLPTSTKGKVRILAVLGNDRDINVQQDKIILEQLPDASTVFLVEPSRQELDKWLWHELGWDILFFAGHSQNEEEKGKLHINKNSSLTISELKNALQHAIARGLKLAIFNSCNGLGLARQLADLHIGQVIVMREDIPDFVAQEFLKHFLTQFASGQSLYLSVRYARSRLQALEDQFPGASLLPVICQNPASPSPTWKELRGGSDSIPQKKLSIGKIQTVLILSWAIACFFFGIRSLGMLQQWELSAFDSMMRMRPELGLDERMLIVTITETDIQNQTQVKKSSLSDQALEKLLQKLEPYQPRVIGLDIYRDFPVDPKYPNLINRLQQNQNFLAICKASGSKIEPVGVPPPPEIPTSRIGFSDVVVDRDLVVRRNLLVITPDPESPCKTRYSFSYQLAKSYLAKQGIEQQLTSDKHLQLGNVVFKPIDAPTGGYQQFDAGGHQILLNYRPTRKIARKVTLSQVLNGDFNPNWVKDKIILIGVVADTVRDTFLTPYSAASVPLQEVPGVIIHAHMVNQILSAVLDRRSLLWVWPAWGEFAWIWAWSLIGSAIAVFKTSKLQLALFSAIALLTLFASCFILLLNAGWIPFLPPVITLTTTSILLTLYTKKKKSP